MNLCLSVNSPGLFVCLLAVVGGLSATEAKPDELDKAAKPAVDPMLGKEPGEVRDDNGLKMKLVWCPPGKFTMGSPPSEQGRLNDEDQVDVTLTNGFWLGKYEVTRTEWKQLMTSEPGKDGAKEPADSPATYIAWDGAMRFCRNLTEQEREAGRLPAGWGYTLPTEAQWEYACRAGTETRFSFGDDESKFGEFAWFGESALGAKGYAHRVGQKKANPWGLHDMHGNVWEWCRDGYTEKRPGGRDPEVKPDEKATTASIQVLRGGSWFNDAPYCRSGSRHWYQPLFRHDFYGFRVALSSVQPVK